ncbi:PAS domain-containing protein, partial [Clostridium sp.]
MEDFFDKLQDKILIIDYSGKILFCNKTLLNQLQYQLDDLDNIYNLIINSNIKFNTIDINCNKEYIVDILTKNNSTIPFKLNLSFSSFNNSDSIFILLRDITSNYLLSENLE